MKYFFLLLALIMTAVGCDVDDCEQTVRYVKATGIYADLESVRVDDLVGAPRDIESPGKINVSSELLIIGDRGTGIHIINNTDPENPQPLHFLEVPGNHQLYVDGDYIYANAYYDMIKIDISDINNIRIVDRIEEVFTINHHNFENHALIGFERTEVEETLSCDRRIDEGQIFFFDDSGVLLEETAIPTSFVSNGTTVGTANRMAIVDNDLFVINLRDIYAFDVSGDNLDIHPVYGNQSYLGWNMETIYARGEFLYTASQTEMAVHRLTGTEIMTIGSYFHATACDPVLPTDEGIAYITLRSGDECPGDVNSLSVVDINNFNNIFLLQEIEMESPFGMYLVDDRLFVGEGDNGLRIFDASQRDALTEIDHFSSLAAFDVIGHPTRADILLLASESGLAQYEIGSQGFEELSQILF